ARLVTRPVPTGSPVAAKTMGMTDVACLAAKTMPVPDVTITSTLRWTNSAAISAARSVRPSVQRYSIAIATLDPAELAQPLYKSGGPLALSRRRGRAQKPDSRQLRWLLRARRERPRNRAAEQRDELAPFHSITSSARPSSGSGMVPPSALAVRRLMISSTFVDWWTGRSAGFSPLRIRPV